MYSHEQLVEFHEEIRTVKEHMWYDHQLPDLYPILAIRWRDMPPQSVDVPRIGSVIEASRDMMIARGMDTWLTRTEMSAPLVLWSCLAAIADGVHLPGIDDNPPKGTPIEGIWLACEGYGLEADDADPSVNIDEIVRGDLQRDYETNPESKVYERLTTYQVETGSTGLGEWGRVTSGFHKDDGGRIVWHEPIVNTSDDTDLPSDRDGYDRLLDIMLPYVTREKLA